MLLADDRPIARNSAEQLLVYATGTPAGFADRASVERLLDQTGDKKYGVRSIVHALVQSELFRSR